MSKAADELASAFGEVDETVDLSGVIAEAWLALAFFWALGLTVFYQFITRYVFNDSAAWTEEIARYLLIATVFVGAVIGVAKNNHIQVDFFFRFMPPAVARGISLLVDVLRIGFLGCASWMTWELMQKMGSYQMTIVNLPMNNCVQRGAAGLCADDMARGLDHAQTFTPGLQCAGTSREQMSSSC